MINRISWSLHQEKWSNIKLGILCNSVQRQIRREKPNHGWVKINTNGADKATPGVTVLMIPLGMKQGDGEGNLCIRLVYPPQYQPSCGLQSRNSSQDRITIPSQLQTKAKSSMIRGTSQIKRSVIETCTCQLDQSRDRRSSKFSMLHKA